MCLYVSMNNTSMSIQEPTPENNNEKIKLNDLKT